MSIFCSFCSNNYTLLVCVCVILLVFWELFFFKDIIDLNVFYDWHWVLYRTRLQTGRWRMHGSYQSQKANAYVCVWSEQGHNGITALDSVCEWHHSKCLPASIKLVRHSHCPAERTSVTPPRPPRRWRIQHTNTDTQSSSVMRRARTSETFSQICCFARHVFEFRFFKTEHTVSTSAGQVTHASCLGI